MRLRYLMIIVAMLGSLGFEEGSQAAGSANLSREQIRQMPIVTRPSRPGHFYGNTVRRAHNRRGG